MAWKKPVSYFSKSNTLSPTSKQELEAAHAAATQKRGGSAVLGLWSVGRGTMELSMGWPALAGGRVMEAAGHHMNSVVFCVCWLDWPQAVSSPGALGNHSQG